MIRYAARFYEESFEAAERIGVSGGTYQRGEDPRKRNARLGFAFDSRRLSRSRG